MNSLDAAIIQFLNGFARRSEVADGLIHILADQPLLKGTLLVALLWIAWFQPSAEAARKREIVIVTIGATILALLVTKVFRQVIPFRPRPLHEPDLHFVPPFHVDPDALWNWSSFPSDTAAMTFALVMGLALAFPRWRTLLFAYGFIVVCLPRVYLGYHYPTDIIAGAAIGMAATAGLLCIWRRAQLGSLMRWQQHYAGAFYAALFLATFEIGSQFENLRRIISLAGKLTSTAGGLAGN